MSPPTHFLSGSGKPPPEKSKFVQTCNRLSLFLKENSKIRDLNFAKFDGTETWSTAEAKPRTIDLLSTIQDDDDDDDDDDDEKAANLPPPPQYVILDSSSREQVEYPKTAQMTIFYGGQVVVLDDVPAERAKDLMFMAHKGLPLPKPNEKMVCSAQAGEKDSDLPIARRASLHKFLAKRKDRATVRASPYPPTPAASSSGNDHTFDLNSNP